MSLSMVLMHTFPVLWYILDRLCWNTLYENNTDKLNIEKEVSGREEHTCNHHQSVKDNAWDNSQARLASFPGYSQILAKKNPRNEARAHPMHNENVIKTQMSYMYIVNSMWFKKNTVSPQVDGCFWSCV